MPAEPIAGVVGEAGEVTVADNTYPITIQSATAQPSAAFGSYSGSQSGGFLVIELSLTRTDTNSSVTQISWFDWMFTPESGEPIEGGALIAGGYEPLLSTLNLQPNETATGLVAFDTPAAVGTLSLENFDGAWAQWPITATTPVAAVGALGTPVQPELARTPFSVTAANPRWVGPGDPVAIFDPVSGTYLVLDVTVTIVEGALGETSSASIGYDSWSLTPDGGAAVTSDFAITAANSLSFGPGLPPSASTVVAFDVARGPGTVSLRNNDGSVLATWVIPPL